MKLCQTSLSFLFLLSSTSSSSSLLVSSSSSSSWLLSFCNTSFLRTCSSSSSSSSSLSPVSGIKCYVCAMSVTVLSELLPLLSEILFIRIFIACVAERGIKCGNKNIGFCFLLSIFHYYPVLWVIITLILKIFHLYMFMAVLCYIYCVFYPLCSMCVRMHCTSFHLFCCQALIRSLFHIQHIMWSGLWRTQHCVLTQLTVLLRDMDCCMFVCFLLLVFPFLVSAVMEKVN
jgi:hypothetical protein